MVPHNFWKSKVQICCKLQTKTKTAFSRTQTTHCTLYDGVSSWLDWKLNLTVYESAPSSSLFKQSTQMKLWYVHHEWCMKYTNDWKSETNSVWGVCRQKYLYVIQSVHHCKHACATCLRSLSMSRKFVDKTYQWCITENYVVSADSASQQLLEHTCSAATGASSHLARPHTVAQTTHPTRTVQFATHKYLMTPVRKTLSRLQVAP